MRNSATLVEAPPPAGAPEGEGMRGRVTAGDAPSLGSGAPEMRVGRLVVIGRLHIGRPEGSATRSRRRHRRPASNRDSRGRAWQRGSCAPLSAAALKLDGEPSFGVNTGDKGGN